MFAIHYAEGWDRFFSKLDNSEKIIIRKKIERLKMPQNQRHLKHGLPYFVTEAGQYMIAYEEADSTRKVIFASNHKQYEKWLREQEMML